jgi:outer membrane protein TolC
MAYEIEPLDRVRGRRERARPPTPPAATRRRHARLKAAESARRANDLARTLYQAGAADFQKIKLYKALGGGWQPARTQQDN